MKLRKTWRYAIWRKCFRLVPSYHDAFIHAVTLNDIRELCQRSAKEINRSTIKNVNARECRFTENKDRDQTYFEYRPSNL